MTASAIATDVDGRSGHPELNQLSGDGRGQVDMVTAGSGTTNRRRKCRGDFWPDLETTDADGGADPGHDLLRRSAGLLEESPESPTCDAARGATPAGVDGCHAARDGQKDRQAISHADDEAQVALRRHESVGRTGRSFALRHHHITAVNLVDVSGGFPVRRGKVRPGEDLTPREAGADPGKCLPEKRPAPPFHDEPLPVARPG